MKVDFLLQYFIPSNISTDLDQIRRARIQVKFILISLLMDISYWVVSSYINFEVVQYVTIFSFFFLFGLLWAFKWGASLIVISHLFVFYFWLVVLTVTFFSGGIESYVLAWISLIPIMAITLLSGKAAWGWGIMGVITVFLFFAFDYDALIPSYLVISKNNIWNASLHIGLQFFILILTYIFNRHQNELINKIKQQKHEISNSYIQLKDLDQYKEAMTAMIVHDFKNSLNTVISFSEGTPTERRLISIRQAGQFMRNMVLNILDVQKFETTEIKLVLINSPISKAVSEAINQLSYIIEQKSIKVIFEINKEINCTYDYELTTRVIVNILSNAIKYVPANGVIDIKTQLKDNVVLTSIVDNGPGIPADKIDMVFDKYSQFNAKSSGSVRSTGIGLTFCKMAVEAQGGAIGVVSEEGKGAEFHFTLPIGEINEEQKQIVVDEEISIKKEKSFVFTKKEIEALKPIITKLKKWEVYDYSEVNAILEKVNHKNANINLWKEQVIDALHNVNEGQYSKLINYDKHFIGQ